jgi:hypothetical protein
MDDKIVASAFEQAGWLLELVNEYEECRGKLAELAVMRNEVTALAAQYWHVFTTCRAFVSMVAENHTTHPEARAELAAHLEAVSGRRRGGDE